MSDSKQLSQRRLDLLKYGTDQTQDNELEDIIQTSIKSVIREITINDILYLSNYMKFPVKRNGSINITGAKLKLQKFLMNQALPTHAKHFVLSS